MQFKIVQAEMEKYILAYVAKNQSVKYPMNFSATRGDEGTKVDIALTQVQIEDAISAGVLKTLGIVGKREVTVEISATRGETGFTAKVDVADVNGIETDDSEDVAEAAPVAAPAPEPVQAVVETTAAPEAEAAPAQTAKKSLFAD